MSHYVLSTLRGGQFCAWCDAAITQYNAGGLCPSAPKPATPEVPEWKGPALEGMVWHDTSSGKIVKYVNGEWVGAPSPLDRALSDFIARRKAKRMRPDLSAESARRDMAATECLEKKSNALGRALSIPLPHDPPMSVRLMPWRGK